jgi:hypothetical protein
MKSQLILFLNYVIDIYASNDSVGKLLKDENGRYIERARRIELKPPPKFDITSIAVQTPRPPPEPGRKIRFASSCFT